MSSKPIGSSLMIGLMLSLILLWLIPSLPIVPSARAFNSGGASAIVGLFNEQRKSNAVIDSGILPNTNFVMDVNSSGVSGGGTLNGLDVNITWGAPLSLVGSAIQGAGCSIPPCLWGPPGGPGSFTVLVNMTTPTSYHLIGHSAYVGGNGTLFRLTFHAGASRGASVIHINTQKFQILNPSAVPYLQIDGYFDNNLAPTFNYDVSLNMTARTIIRKAPNDPSLNLFSNKNVTVSLTLGAGTSSNLTLVALGLPFATVPFVNVGTILTNSSGSTNFFCHPSGAPPPACPSTLPLRIRITGGSAGFPTTTPTGTFPVPVLGNATLPGNLYLIKVFWLRITITPPPPPIYSLALTGGIASFSSRETTILPTACPPSCTFTQELGNYTVISLGANLQSGSNDTITIDSNCPSHLQGGDCVFSKPSGKFPFTTTMNVTTNPASTGIGTFRFNATAITQGTYSEFRVSHNLTFTINVIKTHDLAIGAMTVSRSFGYNSVSLLAPHLLQINATVENLGIGTETFTVNATAKVVLSSDFKLLYFDTNGNSVWNPGEPIIYDTDGSFTYTTGDIVIAGTAPALGSPLSSDFNLRFQDTFFAKDAFGSVVWTAKDPVIYDTNGNGMYDSVDIIPAGQTGIIPPSPGLLLASTSITLAGGCTPNPPGCTQVVTLNWDPASLPRGNYRIGTAAVPVVNEFVLANNYPTPFFVYSQRFKGDINGDCKVNIIDLSTVGGTFGKTSTQIGYNPAADLNNDGVINIIDLVLVAGSFGQAC